MHDELWAGIDLKIENAEFFSEQMGKALPPPDRNPMNIALESTGAIIESRWQRSCRSDNLPNHFYLLRIAKDPRWHRGKWMGLQNDFLSGQSTPTAGVAITGFNEVNGPFVFPSPAPVDLRLAHAKCCPSDAQCVNELWTIRP